MHSPVSPHTPLAQSLAVSQPCPTGHLALHMPPQSMPVSIGAEAVVVPTTPSEHSAVRLEHTRSPEGPQPPPHGTDSTSLAATSHRGRQGVQRRWDASQNDGGDTVSQLHAPHGDDPPQSTPDSNPFWTPSLQDPGRSTATCTHSSTQASGSHGAGTTAEGMVQLQVAAPPTTCTGSQRSALPPASSPTPEVAHVGKMPLRTDCRPASFSGTETTTRVVLLRATRPGCTDTVTLLAMWATE